VDDRAGVNLPAGFHQTKKQNPFHRMDTTAPSERTVLITGAAGGLGRALVAEFAAQGWRVAAAYHSSTNEVETSRIWPIQLDVTRRARVRAAVEQLIARWGRMDALINNAGVTADGLVSQTGGDDWDRVLDANLKGAFLCSQAVLPAMLRQRDGHIINISSFSARRGPAGQANYAAAKAGLIGLTTSLAREAGSGNIRVNAVLPGVLKTRMTAVLTEAQLNDLAADNALGRLNSIEEVARFTAFLATTHNISGQLFQLDSRIGRWT
jgi:3-oxoacyl-[acyl-carrier protein] reductase